ncbi:hypothetical protein [Dyadobacter sp. NIV53]|uniref:hypothetical protein n=1 Tax=Dyadobacter sp. NIV53 TaxID=2861765 RepID=UPI001C8887FD|nr:hypothetical protein [Dyadobacter sp. NIV53]
MIYFIWSLLNLGALVWFLFICFSILKLVRESLGMISTVLFIICCLSFIKGLVANKQQEFYADPEVKGQTVETENIQTALFYNTDLLYVYAKDSLSKEVNAVTVKNGLVIGHDWKPVLTKMYFKDGKFHYTASGIHEWQFLGLTLHSVPEEFKGTIQTK